MSLRTSLKNLIRRDAAGSLRERAADLQADLSRVVRQPVVPAPDFADQVAQAGPDHDVLAGSGIDHRDGTVSYADASGKVSRRPMAHWIGFNALQMHNRVQNEMGRRRIIEANPLPAEEYAAWEAKIRREMRSDAVFALAFQSDRAFRAAQDLRSGAEPISAEVRASADADLIALAPAWQAARDLFALRIQEQNAVSDAAGLGPSRDQPHPEWMRQVAEWRERTGVEAAAAASAEALDELCEIEDRIAELPAASLAGLRLKAHVAQRNEDVAYPEDLVDGLIRDLLAFTGPAAVDWHSPPPGFMASPAIEPTNFAQIRQGLQIELQRLRGIALAEYRRRAASLREGMSEDEACVRKAEIRADLFLPALTAAVDLGSVEAQVLAALGRPAAHDPVFALIEEHRAAYAEWDQLSSVWNEMAPGDPGFAEAMAASDEPGKREVATYDALFTAQPATLPGVVALAEYLCEATERVSPDVDRSDGERSLSIVVNALRAVLAIRDERSRCEISLVGMLDLASATMDELQTIQDVADHVGSTAYAHAWRSCCRLRAGAHGVADYNAAGKLMHWLGDALTAVESAAEKEAMRRTPDDRSDRETRLSMLAVSVIDNGDPEAIEELACELLAHAKVERGEG